MEDIIIVTIYKNKCVLEYPKANIITDACIGKNGCTNDKCEGDMKTPLGEYEIGLVMGINEVNLTNIPYIQINEDMYFVDDINSKYYNQLVNIKNVEKDWNSAEHLIKENVAYQYLMEIKCNPKNIKGKGSAIFLHCKYGIHTRGCISVDKDILFKIINNISKNTKIRIIQSNEEN